MPVRLTEKRIRSLRTSKTQEDILHSLTPGAGLRLSKDGRRTFFALYRSPTARDTQGQPKQRRYLFGEHLSGKLGEARYLSLQEFEREYQIFRGKLALGIDPKDEVATVASVSEAELRVGPAEVPAFLRGMFPEGYAKGTVSHLMALYFEHHAGPYLKPRTVQGYVDTARRHIVPRLGYVSAETLSAPDVRNALSSISRTAPQMTRSFKKVLSAAFQFGIEHMPGIKANPCAGVRITVPKNKGSRWLTDEELSVFLAGVDSLEDRESADVYTLILYSLCRPNEAFSLRAEDIISVNGEKVLRIPASRNKSREYRKRDFLIPLMGSIGDIIEHRSAEVKGKGPLFWTYKGVGYPHQLKESNKVIRSFQGLEDIRPHDLRRTGRTHLPSLGVSEKVAEACLNNAPGEIEGTYNLYSYWNERKQALSLWHHKLEKLRENRPAR